MAVTQSQVAETVKVVLEVLGDLGLPGTKLAQLAIQGIDSVRSSKEAQEKLARLMEQAEENFLEKARQQNLGVAHQWVASMPQHNRPWLREGLKHLLDSGDENQLETLLAQEFARDRQAQRAAHLYLMCVYHALQGMEEFRGILTAIHALRTRANTERLLEENEEQKTQLNQLHQAVNRLVGLPEDLLVAPERPLPVPVPPHLVNFLLVARYRLTEYRGTAFDQSLKDLCDWAVGLETSSFPLGLRIFTGAGGSGKTRLLLEATIKLREAGWWTGFIGVNDLSPQQAEVLVQDARPTLMVVDYLENREQTVRNLLSAMAKSLTRPRKAPLALVLAERRYPHWLKQESKRNRDLSYSEIPELYAQLDFSEHPLPTFANLQERAEFFLNARDTLRQRLNLSNVLVNYPPESLPERPLYLLLLALHAAEGHPLSHPRDEQEILQHTWKREKEAYQLLLQEPLHQQGIEWAAEMCREMVTHLRVLATLGVPFQNIQEVAQFLHQHFPPIQGATQTVQFDWLAAQICHLFTGEDKAIPPIEPDPLADYAVAEALQASPSLLEAALPTQHEIAADPEPGAERLKQVCKVLGRLWHHPEFATWKKRIQTWVETLPHDLAGEEHSRNFWLDISASLPALWGEVVLSATHKWRENIPPEDLPTLAMSLDNLANRYSELNRRAEALQAAEEAVQLYRQLARANPDAFTPHLAGSLNNLAIRYSELNRRAEAKLLSAEAITLLVPFFVQIPEGFFPWMSAFVDFFEQFDSSARLTLPAPVC